MVALNRVFFDTNVLVHAIDPSNLRKREIANQHLDLHASSGAMVVSTQVLAELHVVATRKLRPAMSAADAEEAVQRLTRLSVVGTTPELVLRAIERSRRDELSLWDALVVEAALFARCDTLLSEDLQAGRRFGEVIVVNPFAARGRT